MVKLACFLENISLLQLLLSHHLSFLSKKEPFHMPANMLRFLCSRCLFYYRIAVFELIREKSIEEFHRVCPWEGENEQPNQNHIFLLYSNLPYEYLMKKYILRFQISMQNIIVMHVLNCMTDLLNYHPDLLFRKTPLILQMLIQISLCTELHQ